MRIFVVLICSLAHASLALGAQEEKKKEQPKKEKVADSSPGKEHEAEAGRKLKYAKQTLADAQAAKGEEREKLMEMANKKLQEVIDKYEGSKAAKEAQDLLDKK